MSVAWVGLGVSTAVGLYGANRAKSSADKADATNNRAIDGQEKSAQRQADLAQEQWEYQRDVFAPKADERADAQWLLQEDISNQGLDDARRTREVSDEQFGQAKKSYKYQDQYMQMADDYSSGKMSNTMADEANADVEQRFANAEGSMVRNASRYGINPGSGAFASGLSDMYTEKALAGAGAQTAARRSARDKAEMMVATAAGAGNAGFGSGVSAANASTAALNGASGAGTAGLNGTIAAGNAINNGFNSAGNSFGGAAGSWNGVSRSANNSPGADFYGGAVAGGLKAWGASGYKMPSFGSGSGSGTSSFRADDPYSSGSYFGGGEGE